MKETGAYDEEGLKRIIFSKNDNLGSHEFFLTDFSHSCFQS